MRRGITILTMIVLITIFNLSFAKIHPSIMFGISPFRIYPTHYFSQPTYVYLGGDIYFVFTKNLSITVEGLTGFDFWDEDDFKMHIAVGPTLKIYPLSERKFVIDPYITVGVGYSLFYKSYYNEYYGQVSYNQHFLHIRGCGGFDIKSRNLPFFPYIECGVFYYDSDRFRLLVLGGFRF